MPTEKVYRGRTAVVVMPSFWIFIVSQVASGKDSYWVDQSGPSSLQSALHELVNSPLTRGHAARKDSVDPWK